jgi:hypothetical protein
MCVESWEDTNCCTIYHSISASADSMLKCQTQLWSFILLTVTTFHIQNCFMQDLCGYDPSVCILSIVTVHQMTQFKDRLRLQ